MILNELLKAVNCEMIKGTTDIDISDIVFDSRKVSPNCMFVCLKGANIDGHKFALEAANNGAAAILSEEELSIENVTVVKTSDTRKALAKISSVFFGCPSSKIKTVAITGTKGKTTTACMIKSILEKAGNKVGLIGTLGIFIDKTLKKTDNTTPESYEVQKALREMVDAGCKYAVMEASSIGLKTHRLDEIFFDYGVFTNFSEDHIGGFEHESMEEYLECKGMLFKRCKVGILNLDDASCKDILNGHTCKTYFYGFSKQSNIFVTENNLIANPGYFGVHFKTSGDKTLNVDVPIPGKFSVYNALAALSVCTFLGISDSQILEGLNCVKVKGRVEPVSVSGNYTLLIDYAHNAVSLENILTTLREYNPHRIITMFGAGGNRSKTRRYEMGEISGKLSDLSVITEDNSRDEDINDIIEDIKLGIKKTSGKYIAIPNRREAIRYCMENAEQGDVVVLAGKGHEDYQETKGKKYHFDEREIVHEIDETL